MFPALISISQNIKHISLTFDINDFRIQQDEDGNYDIWSNVLNTCYKPDTLLPALPYIGYNVLVRKTEKYDYHLSSSLKELIRNNVNLARNPVAIPTNMRPSLNVNSNTSPYVQKRYPDAEVEFVGFNDCGDYRLLTFHVCPFEFDATTRSLYLKSHVDFDIHLSANSSASLTESRLTETMKDVIKKMVVNPEDMDMTPREMSLNNNLIHQTGYEYVIVTSNQLKGAFQNLAAWKNHKGIRSKVITVEEIDGNNVYIGSTRQERIKNALSQISGCTYVLLGGDTQNVPTCMCYIGYDVNADSITPADSYYSCLETMNWDIHNNGFYGELNDSVSLVPYLNVSRAPVSTYEEAQIFVNRIINYESAPDTVDWKDNILMSGTTMGYKVNNILYPFYVNGISDSQLWSQMIYNTYIKPSSPNLPKWNGNLTKFYDTYTDISLDGTYDFNASNLQNELAKGYTFVDVKTHGEEDVWKMEGSQNDYCYNDTHNLINNGYTIITTTACLTNAFDYSNANSKCLSQGFINNAQSGILSYLGTSRENWYIPKDTTSLGPDSEYDGLTYRKLFLDKYHRMGKAITEVKREKMSSAVNYYYYSLNRKIWMGLNLIGDPEMPVYLSKPNYFHNVGVHFINDNIYVETGIDDYDICFANQAVPSDYYIARNIQTSYVTFDRHNGVFDVCITKPNYVPYSMVCDKTYLQNITLTGSKTYATNNVMIGSDVTNKIVQGPVAINNGRTNIKVSQGVTITKDFEVKIGAEFVITNE